MNLPSLIPEGKGRRQVSYLPRASVRYSPKFGSIWAWVELVGIATNGSPREVAI